jgi:hypothetical protein
MQLGAFALTITARGLMKLRCSQRSIGCATCMVQIELQ